MIKLRIIAVAAFALVVLATEGMAQRRSGGAVSSGVRGAAIGGLVGGEGAAKKGAAIGAVAGATRTVAQSSQQRNAVAAEAQTRAEYQSTEQYKEAPHADFNEAPPEVLVGAPKKDGKPVETIILKGGKPAVGITYPSDWKLKAEEGHVSAVTADGHGWSVIALLDGVKDKKGGMTKAKQGLEKSLEGVKYDEPKESERGALVVTGTGKTKKSGVEVVFAVGIFESGPGQIAGAAFIIDEDDEEDYKESVLDICQSIRGEKDFAPAKAAAAK